MYFLYKPNFNLFFFNLENNLSFKERYFPLIKPLSLLFFLIYIFSLDSALGSIVAMVILILVPQKKY